MGAIVRRWESVDWPTRRGVKSLEVDILVYPEYGMGEGKELIE